MNAARELAGGVLLCYPTPTSPHVQEEASLAGGQSIEDKQDVIGGFFDLAVAMFGS